MKEFEERWPRMFSNVYCGVELPEGWKWIALALFDRLYRDSPNCKVAQVKEKFGQLRVYVDDCSDEGHKIVSQFETFSQYVCSICGTTAEVSPTRKRGWVGTYCANCRKGMSE